VLSELPEKTEITLHVEMSDDEQAIYESIRRNAIKNLNSITKTSQRQIQVFAEIMKLRRACCHPKLVMANSGVASSKLKLFDETLTEILNNDHKVLVFSQFVDHLSLMRELLDSKGIGYQYLDGRTPTKKRKQAIDDFQAGKHDVFLISLKAGGVGLNLTAADYVIHMDPWWNPAVEDQASDRAHRIGQQRPVTVYRLIVENTIENKIIDLHKNKRDLADSLLGGAHVGGKLSMDDMLRLIEESRT